MKFLITIFAVISSAMIVMAGCQKAQIQSAVEEDIEGTEAAATAEAANITMPTPSAALASIVVGSTPFSVEIAETDEEKARGLMGRESLPANSGMWFVFGHPVQEEFWMKDTLIPLDIVFVGENMKVVHFKENAVPKSVEMISSPVPFMYVLEINAGKVAEHGIKVGDIVEKKIGTQ